MNRIIKLCLLILMSCVLAFPLRAHHKNFKVSVYVRAYEVEKMKDTEWLESSWKTISSQLDVDKIYLETQRDMLLVDALVNISSGKLGLGIVLDDDQRVFGIITDGDIRRAVENRKQNFLSVKVSDVMTLHPKTINPEAKLAQIQLMFRRHKIHSLLVVDDDQHLIGIVDYFAIMN